MIVGGVVGAAADSFVVVVDMALANERDEAAADVEIISRCFCLSSFLDRVLESKKRELV